MDQKPSLEHIREYLAGNTELRQAIGAGPGTELVPRHLGEGEHNLNYRFVEPASGRTYILRVNVATQPFHKNQVAYEYAALEALESSGCTPKPIYLDDSSAAPGKGALVESFCEGRQLDFDHLQPGDLECATRLMAEVHAVPVSVDCPLFRPSDPLRNLFDECVQRFEVYRSSAFEQPRLTRWCERFIGAAEQTLATSPAPDDCTHIINTETLPSHFLVTSANSPGKGAFVDWERPIIGEVAQDVAYFTAPTTTFWDSDYLFPASQAESVVESYWRVVDGRFPRGNFDERFRAFRAMTALRSVTWCCRALIQYSQPGAHKTEKTERKLPVYLSDDFMHLLMEECFNL